MTFTNLKPLIEKEVLTLKPSTLLNLTLAPYLPKSENFNSTLKFDTPLPYNYHLAYFFSQHLESKLANDGYDLDHFPKSRRIMWHSGRLLYTHNNLMKYGQEVSCQTSIIKEDKIISSNYKKELVKVMKQKEYFNQMGHSMTEIRSLVYFDGEDKFHMKVKENGKEIEVEEGEMKFSLTTNPVLLFRYSALTFNAHQIHYNSNYAKMEGYQGKSFIIY
ncbi:hypothetical protein K502DRAFT_324748 [Neoconidiobolus thromboides FSU 785]|nr:hypothetical protein K502DRAFT_324748 [Neoconidiobolus thromboides FSU 785]